MRIPNIARQKLYAIPAGSQVFLAASLEVVKDTNGSVTARDESFNEMTADETGAAADEDFGTGVGFQK